SRYRLVVIGRDRRIGRDCHLGKTDRSGTAQRRTQQRGRNIVSAVARGNADSRGLFSAGFTRLLSARSSALASRSTFLRNEFSGRCAPQNRLQQSGEACALTSDVGLEIRPLRL